MKCKSTIAILALCASLSVGCASNNSKKAETTKDENLYASNILALNWQQQSGEQDALCYQAYNVATNNLKQKATIKSEKPLAVILDIDETVLDNSTSAGDDIKQKRSYTKENFIKWSKQAKAPVINGADEFLKKAKELGIEAFYVTNRYGEELDSTIKNLQKYDIPYADKEHVLLRDKESSKVARWSKIEEKYNVVMYLGDNLDDFSSVFEKKSNDERQKLVSDMKSKFGEKYIVLPNPVYGAFEGAMYNYDYKKSETEKYKMRYDLINK